MRVLIYSPVRLFAEGVAAFLLTTESIGAVQVEHDVTDLDTKVLSFQADVALFDITGTDTMEIARLINARCPDVATVAIAVAETAEKVIACADAGFGAYIPLGATAPQMLEIIYQAHRGGTLCEPSIARSLFGELARRRPATAHIGPDDRLTPREAETARMLGRGYSNKEIANELHLSVATVKNHVHSVLHKMQVKQRSQVANQLVQYPWIIRLPYSQQSPPASSPGARLSKLQQSG